MEVIRAVILTIRMWCYEPTFLRKLCFHVIGAAILTEGVIWMRWYESPFLRKLCLTRDMSRRFGGSYDKDVARGENNPLSFSLSR